MGNRESGWERGKSGWECEDSEWECGESGWEHLFIYLFTLYFKLTYTVKNITVKIK